MWKVGLVELYVELLSVSASVSAAVQVALKRQSRSREATIRDVLAHKELLDLDVLAFPGWTLVGEALPSWVTKACGNRAVVIEMLHGRADAVASKHRAQPKAVAGLGSPPWSTYVVQGGSVVVDGARQLIVEANDARGDDGVKRVDQLSSQLQRVGPTGRRFSHSMLGEGGVLICGEVNSALIEAGAVRVPPRFPRDLSLIVNPAHTPSSLDAMRRKRAALSLGRVLVTVANGHSRCEIERAKKDGTVERKVRGPRWHSAECFIDGRRLNVHDAGRHVDFSDASVAVFQVAPP
jgi:hypothetical protein